MASFTDFPWILLEDGRGKTGRGGSLVPVPEPVDARDQGVGFEARHFAAIA